jgi:mitochondrial fission protein ELM1
MARSLTLATVLILTNVPFLPLLIDTSENPRWQASSKDYALQLAREDAAKGKGHVFEKRPSTTPSMLGASPRQAYYAAIPQEQYETEKAVVMQDPRAPQNLTHHTVVATRPDGSVFTKGAFNNVGDGWSPAHEILGQVRRYFSW